MNNKVDDGQEGRGLEAYVVDLIGHEFSLYEFSILDEQWQFSNHLKKILLPSAVTGRVKWVKASERLPEQYVCCRIPAEKIDYVYFNSSAMIGKLSDVDPNLEWLDEGQPAQE